MRIIQKVFVIGLAVAAILSARAEESEAVKKDMALLEGEWTMVSGSGDGVPMPEAYLPKMKRVCKGNESTTTMDGKVYIQAKIKIDPAKKPKTMDYEMIDGITKGQKQLGIYQVNGDTFRSCVAKPGAERPTDFTTKSGDGRTLSMWKRVKVEKKEVEKKDAEKK